MVDRPYGVLLVGGVLYLWKEEFHQLGAELGRRPPR